MSKLLKLWAHRRFDSQGAFERVIDPHMTALYRLAWRWCGNASDAEDLLQELMCKLYPRRTEVLAVDKLRPWLIRVMYRLFVDGTRRQRPLAFSALAPAGGEAEPDGDGPDFADNLEIEADDNPEADADRQLSRERLEHALQRLPEARRALLVMHDVEGYSLPELADMLETPAGTLKVQLHRTRERLRTLLWNTGCNPSPGPCVSSSEDVTHEL